MNRREVLAGAAVTTVGASMLFTSASANEKTQMAFTSLKVTTQGAVMVLEMALPPINGVSIAVLRDINAALDIAENDPAIGALVITGSDGLFSGGAGENGPGETGPKGATHSDFAYSTFNRMEAYRKPIIAAVRGLAANGGNELALACDIRIAADNARFAQLEVHAGLFPGFGGAQRLPRLIGHGRAKEMILTGRMVGAEEALTMGLVSRVSPLQETLKEAVALGEKLANELDTNALGVYKGRMSLAANESHEKALKNDQLAFNELADSPEAKAALERFIARQRSKY